MDASAKTQPPSWHHLMGTDNFGRDIFSRVLGGGNLLLWWPVAVVAIGCVFGLLIGGLCGYYGGVADADPRAGLCDALTAFPAVLLALVILSVAERRDPQHHPGPGHPVHPQLRPGGAGGVRPGAGS